MTSNNTVDPYPVYSLIYKSKTFNLHPFGSYKNKLKFRSTDNQRHLIYILCTMHTRRYLVPTHLKNSVCDTVESREPQNNVERFLAACFSQVLTNKLWTSTFPSLLFHKLTGFIHNGDYNIRKFPLGRLT